MTSRPSPAISAEKSLDVLFSSREIYGVVERLAAAIREDYEEPLSQEGGQPGQGRRELLLVGVLKGAFIFMADLVRALEMPMTVDFMRVSTYGRKQFSNKNPRLVQGLRTPVKGRDVLVVEDIVDTGVTTNFLLDYLKGKGAASVRLCALLSKPSRREVDVGIDYLGFTVGDLFVVGYGLDFGQRYRYLRDICVLEDK